MTRKNTDLCLDGKVLRPLSQALAKKPSILPGCSSGEPFRVILDSGPRAPAWHGIFLPWNIFLTRVYLLTCDYKRVQKVHTGSQEMVEGLSSIMTWPSHNTDSTGSEQYSPHSSLQSEAWRFSSIPGCRFLKLVSLELSNQHCSLSKDATLFFFQTEKYLGSD